jgi:SOS-response transcriptional repressor LexA
MNANQQKILDLAKTKDISRMSLTDIAKELDIDHLYKVQYHLDQLKKKNLIYIDTDKKTHKVAKLAGFLIDSLLNIPIVGAANCGPALELAQEDISGFLKISKRLVDFSKPENLIAVRAVGESLNKAKIKGESVESGDYLIVDCKMQPRNNDYVLSVIDGAANFKKFYKDDKKKEIRLISESTFDVPPIVLHEDDVNTLGYVVNGVVAKVVKN